MKLTTILLLFVVILLIILIVLLVNGWPTGRRHEPTAIGKEFRQDLAQLRGEMLQHLDAIRGDIEHRNDSDRTISALFEQTERIMAMLQQQTGYKRIQKRKSERDAAVDAHIATGDSSMEETVATERETMYYARQLTLFPAEILGNEDDKDTGSEDSSEFISVPAADFDPDLDPPYDPDAELRNP